MGLPGVGAGANQFLIFGARIGAGAGAMFLVPVPVNIGMLVLVPV